VEFNSLVGQVVALYFETLLTILACHEMEYGKGLAFDNAIQALN